MSPQPVTHEWRVAVIGAGVAGATAAAELRSQGAEVVLLDKGRGPGGRCATRRHDSLAFDHGAQYFTARDPGFKEQVHHWVQAGAADAWRPRGVHVRNGEVEAAERGDLYVGTPKMNTIVRHQLNGLDARFGVRVSSMVHRPDGWRLTAEDGAEFSGFSQVAVTVPATQAVPLLTPHFPEAVRMAAGAHVSPCWSVMLAYADPVQVPFDTARFTDENPLAWAARNTSKPGRPADGPDCWVLHASHEWSRDHLESDVTEAGTALTASFTAWCKLLGEEPRKPLHVAAHRWRYALSAETDGPACMAATHAGLAVGGDWMLGGRIESAWLSGCAVAKALVSARASDAVQPERVCRD